jgi:hypothetical protein
MPFSHKSAFSKFKCEVTPLRIETGCFDKLPVQFQIECFCLDFIEDETHVL